MATHTYGSHRRARSDTTLSRSIAQALALLFGVAFLGLGSAGFIPGLTEQAADISVSGHDSPAKVLGVFQVSVLHNVVHLAFGVMGLLAAARPAIARTFLVAGGGAYLALAVYGLMIDLASEDNFIPLNDADNWLHLALGSSMVLLGLLATRRYDDV